MTDDTTRPPVGTTAPAATLDNYRTDRTGRVPADKTISVERLDELLAIAKAQLSHDRTYTWDANLDGIVVRLTTNSRHQADFWRENWWPAPNDGTLKPHARIVSVTGVPDMEPRAYYCPERDTSVFVNTEYYGQCKSWALGMVAAIQERHFNTHAIHGACADVNGKGIVIIAPTGTGKTTLVNKLFQLPGGRVVGDDWIYIAHPDEVTADTRFEVHQPEKSLYVRTENALEEDWLRPIFKRCKLENVPTDPAACHHEDGEPCGIADGGDDVCLWGFGNARAMLPREWMKGPEKVADTAPLNLVVLLRRDDESPAELWLDPDEAVEVLYEGRYQIRPGAGPEELWGTMGHEPWYNPYLLVPDHERQRAFFRAELEHATCLILNTGPKDETPDRSVERILAALEKA